MHHIYQTEGIILGSANFGEANKHLFILTKDFGLIKVAAQGLRRQKSKLRCSLQDFSLSELSLVRGRNIWRITNAAHKQNFYNSLSADTEKLTVALQMLILLKKLLPGESPNQTLYKIIKQALLFLEREQICSADIGAFENIILIRILRNLGYFDEQKEINNRAVYKNFLKSFECDRALLDEMNKIKPDAIRDINNALAATHLW
ncbi:MAG: DNA repair protein RecO [Candidatus Pacebacteria bacterium]|nr:DNA repair protein RecO [Candidatus Paceibacterota bacterium]